MTAKPDQASDWPETIDGGRLIPVPLGADLRPLTSFAESIRLWLSRQPTLRGASVAGLDVVLGNPGYFFVVAPAAARLHPDFVEIVEQRIAARPDVQIFYGDDAVEGDGGSSSEVHCKPQLSRALLFAQDYIGFPLIIRSDALCAADHLPRIDTGGFWYDFCLMAVAANAAFDRIPHTLMMARSARSQARIEDRLSALSQNFPGFEFAESATAGSIRAKRKFADYPAVTIIVPTNRSKPEPRQGDDGGMPHIASLLGSLSKSTWPMNRIKLLIGDDTGDDGFYDQFDLPFSIEVVDTRRPDGERFNYARKVNRLWRQVDTELIVILNDDIVIEAPDWLESLYTFGLERDVGGVGARLMFPNGTIQHAGMVGGIYEVFAHAWYKCEDAAPTYENWASVHRDVSAVTGAAFATRRSVLEAVNGLDETFALDFNDVDLCLKMQLLGYRIVYTPHARMTHHESASRGAQFAPGAEISIFLNRWRDCIRDDPMFNPQLSRTDSDVRVSPSAVAAFGSSS